MQTVLPLPSSEEPYFSRSVRMRVSVCLAQKARSMRKLTYRADGGRLGDDLVDGIGSRDLLRDERGRLAQRLCQAEAGEGVVTHFRVGGEGDRRIDLLLREFARAQAGGDVAFEVHSYLFRFFSGTV